jgi:hypothetical protein
MLNYLQGSAVHVFHDDRDVPLRCVPEGREHLDMERGVADLVLPKLDPFLDVLPDFLVL